MKYSIPLFLLFGLIFSINDGIAEINNKKVLMGFFEGCMEEELPDIPVGAQFDYCGCFTKEISQGMNFEELVALGIDAISVGENEKKRVQLVLSNQKMKKYIVNCASKLYE
jgi:hypothetical protein